MIDVGVEDFEKEVLQAEGPVLVDFNAEWCGPCRAMAATLEPLAGDFKIVMVNIDEQPELAAQYEVMSIPCLVVFKDGTEVARTVGMQSKRRILKMMEKAR